MPGPGWRVDVFWYASRDSELRLGFLYLDWDGKETSVRYAHALRQEITPWHGRWEVSPQNSHKSEGIVVKDHWTRTVYFDYHGREEDVKPMYLGLGMFTDHFEGIDSEGLRIDLMPCTSIGKGLEYGSREYTELVENLGGRRSWSRMRWLGLALLVLAPTLIRRARM